MSRKKQKKHTYQPNVGKNPEKLQQTSKTKKMNPLARNLLLIDLVMLGVSEMLIAAEKISETVANGIALVGVVMILVAVYLEFGPKSGRGKGLGR